MALDGAFKVDPFEDLREMDDIFDDEEEYYDDDFADFVFKGLYGKMLRNFMVQWEMMNAKVPKMWTPKPFRPDLGPELNLTFKPIVFDWLKLYKTKELGIPFTIRPGYGTAVLVGMIGGCLLSWNYRKVKEARVMYNVPPLLTVSETSKEFNCYWRAYETTVQAYPHFLFSLLMGATEFPYLSSAGGLIWIWGRYVYSKAWHAGKSEDSFKGIFYLIGSCMLNCLAFAAAMKKVKAFRSGLPDMFIYKNDHSVLNSMKLVEKFFQEEWIAFKPKLPS